MPAPTQQDIELKARQGLALLLAGDDAGLTLYRDCLHSDYAQLLPFGAHIEFLERGGRPDQAAELRDLALARGGDIARSGTTLAGEPIDAVEEYEALLGQGRVNSRMILHYLVELVRRGDQARIATIFDPDLIRIVRIDEGLAAPVRDLLLAAESGDLFREESQSVRNMVWINNLPELGPPMDALIAALDVEAQAYLADWRASGQRFAPLLPGRVRTKPWALISRTDGFNVPHVHHRGWATGVYYPIGLERGEGGELCIGRPDQASPGAPEWPETRIRPEAGMLVLTPSYYSHWTRPLARPGLRMSIAFDMMPLPG